MPGKYVTNFTDYHGDLWTWGDNRNGMLGTNNTTPTSSPVQTFAGGTNWKQVSNNGYFAAAIRTDGTLWLWGKNTAGQLGDNTRTQRFFAGQTICGGTNWKQVSCSYSGVGAIKTDGTLWLWGDAWLGNEGGPSKTSSPIQTVAGGTNWAQVSIGLGTAATKTDGTLWTWGNNTYGGLGDNTVAHKSSPVQTVAGGTNWKQVAVGYSNNIAAIKIDGTLWLWGRNDYGQLGDNTIVHKSSPIQTIAGGTNWKQLSLGNRYAAAIKTDGTLWMWGINFGGRLGDNTTTHKSSPVQTVAGGTNWKQITTGNHNGGIKTDGTLWTWGYNSYGALGDNTTADKSSPVQTVAGGTNWMDVSTGYNTSLGIRGGVNVDLGSVDVGFVEKDYLIDVYPQLVDWSKAPSLWGWGNNSSGKLGDNTVAHKSSPVQTVAGGTNWKSVTVNRHIVAIKTDGTLWTWGSNNSSQLGDNTQTSKSSPVQTIAGGTNWKQASTGSHTGDHTTAIKTDGTLWLWGSNTNGQLGTNDRTNRSSPVQTVAGGTDWRQVCAGLNFTTAIKTDGTLWTWGKNSYGQLGDNTVAHKSSPVQTVAGGTDWKSVSAGGYHTIAIKIDSTLWLWGDNLNGQIGDNSVDLKSSPVQTVAGGIDWKQIVAGTTHSAAIKTDGTLWTWGSNVSGQLGDNTIIKKSSPVQTVAGGTNWKQVAGTRSTVAAIKTDGTLWLWGTNSYGGLGDNTQTSKSSPIQTVAGGTNWKQVSCGYTTFAIKEESGW